MVDSRLGRVRWYHGKGASRICEISLGRVLWTRKIVRLCTHIGTRTIISSDGCLVDSRVLVSAFGDIVDCFE